MPYLRSITVYFWSANHIALHIKENTYIYENGTIALEMDDDDKPVRQDKFRSLTHDSDYQKNCTTPYVGRTVQDAINDLFDNTKKKKPSVITDFWEDCSQYIREDQIQILKALYELVLTHYALQDDEDFDDEYDDEQAISEAMKQLLSNPRNGAERRQDALAAAEQFELLKPLLTQLKNEPAPIKKKYILLNYIEQIKNTKGLGINVSDDADEEALFGKLPLKEWTLPLGNSLTDETDSHFFSENLVLFGIHPKGVDNGIKKFDRPDDFVHHENKGAYYKFYSRYHNCAGYSRFLLEQAGQNHTLLTS